VFALLNNESLQNQFQLFSDQLIAVKAEGTLNYELKNFHDSQQNFEEALAIFTEIQELEKIQSQANEEHLLIPDASDMPTKDEEIK
jgi:hypothetical protein